MIAFFKAVFSFLMVFMYSLGVIPMSTEVDYGGDEYEAVVIEESMYLVKDGKSDFVIVTAKDADECILTAVNELQTYIKRISGAELPHITEDSYTDGQNAVIIGKCALAESVCEYDFSDIKADGFLLYSDGSRFLLKDLQAEVHFTEYIPSLRIISESVGLLPSLRSFPKIRML